MSKPAKKRGASRKSSKKPEGESTNLVPIKGTGAPVEVLTVDETYANSVHLRIMGLLKQYQETYFELAKSLFDVSVRKLYRRMDHRYPTFQAYVEDAVGIDFRKAKYLVSIWWWYGVEQGADPKLLQGAQEIGWCVHPDTLVTTPDGARPIWSIVPGDIVMGADGKWTGVLDKMVVPFEDAYKVKVVKCGEIVASEGHGFDVIRDGVRHRKSARESGRAFDCSVERVNAEDLRVGDMMIVPCLSKVLVESGEFEERCEEFFEFAGWYVAEGYTYGGQVCISLGVNAEAERDHLFNLAKHVFPGHSVRRNGSRKSRGFRMTVSGDGIDQEFDKWFGIGSKNKRFPIEFYGLSEKKILAFIRGLCGGDGSHSDKGTHIILTTSRALAYQTRTLLTRLGVLAGVFHEKREGRLDAWIVTIGRGEADDLLGEWCNKVSRKYAHYIKVPGGFAVPVRSIEVVELDVPLVHLETESGRFCCPVVSYNSKAKELVKVVDKKNADRWFGLAKQMNKGDLAKAARAALKNAGEKRGRRAAPESVFDGEFELKDDSSGNEQPEVFEQDGSVTRDTDESEESKAPKLMSMVEPAPLKGMKVAGSDSPEGVVTADSGEQQTDEPEEPEEVEGVEPPEDLENAVAQEKAESAKWKRVHFDIHEEFREVIKDALDSAMREGETGHKGYALSLVCLHYLSFYSKKWETEVGEWLRRIERVTGLTLVALNEKTDEIIYGGELLRRLAGSEEEDDADQSRDGDEGDGVGEEGTGIVDSGDTGPEAGGPKDGEASE